MTRRTSSHRSVAFIVRSSAQAPLGAGRKFRLGNLLHFNRTRPHFVAYYVRDLPAFAPLVARYLLGMKLLTWTIRTDAERSKARRWANQMIFEGFRP